MSLSTCIYAVHDYANRGSSAAHKPAASAPKAPELPNRDETQKTQHVANKGWFTGWTVAFVKR